MQATQRSLLLPNWPFQCSYISGPTSIRSATRKSQTSAANCVQLSNKFFQFSSCKLLLEGFELQFPFSKVTSTWNSTAASTNVVHFLLPFVVFLTDENRFWREDRPDVDGRRRSSPSVKGLVCLLRERRREEERKSACRKLSCFG